MSLLTIPLDIQELIGYHIKFCSVKYVIKKLTNKVVKNIITLYSQDIRATQPSRFCSFTNKELYNLINNHNIKFLSHVSNNELVALIKVSDILLNPTLEEGFGLPNIEAQICEIIVVSSNTSCIPEILSNSAILVDPLNKDEIYNSCLNVLENKIDCEKIIKNGVENSLRYTDINNYDNLYKIILNLLFPFYIEIFQMVIPLNKQESFLSDSEKNEHSSCLN